MKIAHAYVYGDIGHEPSKEWAEAFGLVRLQDIVAVLNDNADADEIIVHIHSRGGDVIEGFAIHDALVNSGKKVTTIVEGLCASIATVIALAGSTRKMTKNSEFMIHNPWTLAVGDADDVQKQADELKKAEDKLINFYNEKTGADKEQLDQMMKAETWLTVEQALEMKFITEILSEVKAFARFGTKLNDNQIKTEMSKLKKEVSESNALVATLKTAYKKLTGKDWNSETAVAKALDISTEAGETMHVETEEDAPKVGDKVTINEEAQPNKEFKMSDGTTIKTDADSKISEIVPAETSATEEEIEVNGKKMKLSKELAEDIKAELKKQGEDEQKEIEQLKKNHAEIASITAKMQKLVSKPIEQNNNPVFNRSTDIKTEKEIEEMTKKFASRHKQTPAK